MKVQIAQGDCEASLRALAPLDSDRTLVVVFGAPDLADNHAPLKALERTMKASKIVGCSSAGHFLQDELTDEGIVCAAIRFDSSAVRVAGENVGGAADSCRAGQAVGAALCAPDLRGVLVYSEGLEVNGAELAKGLAQSLPAGVVATGGLAGDQDRFSRTWVCEGAHVSAGRVVAAGLYGDDLRLGHASKGGWDVFGPVRKVTRASGNILYELDGKPALEIYKAYLGDRASELPASALLFPLAISETPNDVKPVVRTILAVDEKENAMVFAGDIPQDAFAQLMRANLDRLIHAASESALDAQPNDLESTDVLSIAVSCVGRRLVLGERAEEELGATLDTFPSDSRQIGFYSYGELSPLISGACDLHNQTMTLTVITEAKAA